MTTRTSTLPELPKTGHPIVLIPVIFIINEKAILEIIRELEGCFPEETTIDITEQLSEEDVARHSVIIFLNSPAMPENHHLGCYCMKDGKHLSILACEKNKSKREITIEVLTALKSGLEKID
ncbi:MAG: hypothetical protein HGA61_00325 [Candidatus Moranbacteria bacterium]|nr:hypothetical protein [Candidatus Moranbacteria bacterium]